MINKRNLFPVFLLLFNSVANTGQAQATSKNLWHGITREIHYKPDGEDFVCVNGTRRFNRALYGSNTAFRAEAGDLPEFALYMPGMGGNLKFGLIVNDTSKWLINAANITARYRPGSMLYEVKDMLLGNGSLFITVLPLFDGEGIIVKAEVKDVPAGVKLFAAFGGATGSKFSRDGDIGADPESSFYLKPEYCKDYAYNIQQNNFTLYYGSKKPLTEEQRYEIQLKPVIADTTTSTPSKKLTGIFPANAQLKTSDATQQQSPLLFYNSKATNVPALTSQVALENNSPVYYFIQNPNSNNAPTSSDVAMLFQHAEAARQQLAGRIKISTPDPYINTLGGALAVAADAVWEAPSFMHGAVAWRMRLNGWRGAYAADALGWHDRARQHFDGYALSQLTSPASGPVVADTALHLARQAEKIGTSVFSSGYITRNPGGQKTPHHYDMNLVFIDQLLNHFLFTGDTAYVRRMWPLLQRHLAWEKRNFDVDGDGLYDAYAAIWASDALQYSGGGVTHSSAYNYRSNKIAAELAKIIGEDSSPYRKEAEHILKAMNDKLWLPSAGVYAEYKDLLGLKRTHPAAALWTIYHAVDSYVTDNFKVYQSLRYIDNEIPHISIRANGLTDTTLYTLSTTNWQPYTWSLNNVALGELMHTSLAYWQGHRNEEAYQLWRSSLIESMYLGASPGNIQQLSFYDAIRGELYRDFADPIGMTARSLVEGLFGVFPDALHDTLHITPGFPAEWNNASLTTPDITYAFKRNANTDHYTISSYARKQMNLQLVLKAKTDAVDKILVNGKPAEWKVKASSIETPMIIITATPAQLYDVQITWKGNVFEKAAYPNSVAKGEAVTIIHNLATIQQLYDAQKVLANTIKNSKKLKAVCAATEGNKTFFIQLKQGAFTWWEPINIKAVRPIEIVSKQEPANDQLNLNIRNNTSSAFKGVLLVNGNRTGNNISIPAMSNTSVTTIPSNELVAGSNRIEVQLADKRTFSSDIINWNINNNAANKYDKIDLDKYYNDAVTNIFKNEYLSPRPKVPTLQLPTQGIGNWAYALTTSNIDDAGLRKRASSNNEIVIGQGIPFRTPSVANKNIIFTSLWDNYPDSIKVPLQGKASHAYLLMAGSTNPMQSRFTNGEVTVQYKDGSSEKLSLINPQTWWPIEQDYYTDGYAFTTDAPKPVRVYLKTGEDTRSFNNFITIKGFSSYGIDGGAATVLDLPLNKQKELKNITLRTLANDVVIGLMSLTLVR